MCLTFVEIESKLKVYCGVNGINLDESRLDLPRTIAWMEEKIKKI